MATNYDANLAQKLFRFVGRGHGEWLQNNMRISIENIAESNNSKYRYGTFDVVLRYIDAPEDSAALETFSKCTLDPNSANFIGKKVGDRYVEWDATNTRIREYGVYDNLSEFVRVEMNESVKRGSLSPELLPFGVHGPVRFKGFSIRTNAEGIRNLGDTASFANAFAEGSGSIPNIMLDAPGYAADKITTVKGDVPETGQPEVSIGNTTTHWGFRFPAPRLVKTAGEGYHKQLGVEWAKHTSATDDVPRTQFDPSALEALRRLPAYYAALESAPYDNDMEYSWIFTLDDVQLDYNAENNTESAKAYYVSGSRQLAGTTETNPASVVRPDLALRSWTAASGAFNSNNTGLLDPDLGYNAFATFFHGGFDGMDVQEREPFRNTYLDDAAGDRTVNYGYNTVYRAIDTLSDPEYVEFNIMSMPGLTENNLTKRMVEVCETRADALAIIDVDGGFQPWTESNATETSRRGTINAIASNMKSRELDSSYGCAYYPWVQVRDNRTGDRIWMPPSVVGVGVMGGSQAKAELWFAPAGFVRGGLTSQGMEPGAAGLKILNVKERLTSLDRDKLYEQSVNPIAKFPSEGLVVFGQKTLQLTPSALDRINVRRLMLYVKKEISIIASTTLFGQNVQTTGETL